MLTFPFFSNIGTATSTSYYDYGYGYLPSSYSYLIIYKEKEKSDNNKNEEGGVKMSILDFQETMKRMLVSLNNMPFPKYRLLVKEKTEEAIVEFALAGYSKENISISLRDAITESPQLFIKIDEVKDAVDDGFEFVAGNLKHSKVSFGFFLPKYMKVTNATFENGLLRIHLKMEIPLERKDVKVEIS